MTFGLCYVKRIRSEEGVTSKYILKEVHTHNCFNVIQKDIAIEAIHSYTIENNISLVSHFVTKDLQTAITTDQPQVISSFELL